jgi:Asp-tRNA(Asn)/Glu-tRNA(Gln) amidotransferase A subunit family amidase
MADARGVRLGAVGGYFAQHVHPDVTAGVERLCADLAAAGATVEPVDGSGIDDARAVWRAVCFPEFAAAHPLLSERLDLVLDPAIASSYRRGAAMTADERRAAAARRAAIAAWFGGRLEGRDALVVPTTGYPAPFPDARELDLGAAGTIDLEQVAPGWFTSPVNLAGLPAVTVPAGRSSGGLPFGVTLIGPAGSEERLLALAALWEAATGYRPWRPPLSAG